jgi:hypothetical protein
MKKHLATKCKEYEKYKMLQHMNPIPSDTLFSGNVSNCQQWNKIRNNVINQDAFLTKIR